MFHPVDERCPEAFLDDATSTRPHNVRHLTICGAPSSGRSSALRMLVESYDQLPRERMQRFVSTRPDDTEQTTRVLRHLNCCVFSDAKLREEDAAANAAEAAALARASAATAAAAAAAAAANTETTSSSVPRNFAERHRAFRRAAAASSSSWSHSGGNSDDHTTFLFNLHRTEDLQDAVVRDGDHTSARASIYSIIDGCILVSSVNQPQSLSEMTAVLSPLLCQRIKPILMLCKIDTLFFDPPAAESVDAKPLESSGGAAAAASVAATLPDEVLEAAYQRIAAVIALFNSVLAMFERFENLEDCDDENKEVLRVEPREVIFASTVGHYQWTFTLSTFAARYARKFGVDEERLVGYFFGDTFFDARKDTKTTRFVKTPVAADDSSIRFPRAFCHFVLSPIAQIVRSCLAGRFDRVDKMCEQIGVPAAGVQKQREQLKRLREDAIDTFRYNGDSDAQDDRDRKTQSATKLATYILACWLPPRAAAEAIVRFLPDPVSAAQYRAPILYSGPRGDRYYNAMLACRPDDHAGDESAMKAGGKPPLLVSIAAMVPSLLARGRFFCIARVWSGAAVHGARVRILVENQDTNSSRVSRDGSFSTAALAAHMTSFCTAQHRAAVQFVEAKPIQRVVPVAGGGRFSDPVESVVAGHLCVLIGLDRYVVSTATLTNAVGESRLQSLIDIAKFTTAGAGGAQLALSTSASHPTIRVAIAPKNPTEMPRLVEGVKAFVRENTFTSRCHAEMADDGSIVVSAISEAVLWRTLADIYTAGWARSYDETPRRADIQSVLEISAPSTNYRETVMLDIPEASAAASAASATPMTTCASAPRGGFFACATSPNKHNKLWVRCCAPLHDAWCSSIERGDFNPMELCNPRCGVAGANETATTTTTTTRDLRKIFSLAGVRDESHSYEERCFSTMPVTPQKIALEVFRTGARSFGIDEPATQRIWCFGPDKVGPNVLINSTAAGRGFAPGAGSSGFGSVVEIYDSCAAAFHWATTEGPLLGRPLRGCRFDLEAVVLHSDAIHRGGGQIIPTLRRALYGSFLACPSAVPMLLEPKMRVDIACVQYSATATGTANVVDAAAAITEEIAARGGEVDKEVRVRGTAVVVLSVTILGKALWGIEDALVQRRGLRRGDFVIKHVGFDGWVPAAASHAECVELVLQLRAKQPDRWPPERVGTMLDAADFCESVALP